jgi:hypothetical protein
MQSCLRKSEAKQFGLQQHMLLALCHNRNALQDVCVLETAAYGTVLVLDGEVGPNTKGSNTLHRSYPLNVLWYRRQSTSWLSALSS